MSRFANLFKNFVSPEDEIATPSFIKPSQPSAPTSGDSSALPVPKILISPTQAYEVKPEAATAQPPAAFMPPVALSPVSSEVKIIVVPIYQSDTEWEVVQRTVHIFSERVRLSGESKQAFTKKWIELFEKTNQKTLYRRPGEDVSSNHLGNKIDRTAANPAIRQVGTYEAAIDPVKEAGMNYDLQALRLMELTFAAITNNEVAREVKNDLRSVILGTTPEQTVAAQQLLTRVQSGKPECEKIYAATKTLANSNELRLNATLKSTVLKMDANKYQQLGVQTKVEERIEVVPFKVPTLPQSAKTEKTVQAAEKDRAATRLSDSDWVNKQALDLLGDLKTKRSY